MFHQQEIEDAGFDVERLERVKMTKNSEHFDNSNVLEHTGVLHWYREVMG